MRLWPWRGLQPCPGLCSPRPPPGPSELMWGRAWRNRPLRLQGGRGGRWVSGGGSRRAHTCVRFPRVQVLAVAPGPLLRLLRAARPPGEGRPPPGWRDTSDRGCAGRGVGVRLLRGSGATRERVCRRRSAVRGGGRGPPGPARKPWSEPAGRREPGCWPGRQGVCAGCILGEPWGAGALGSTARVSPGDGAGPGAREMSTHSPH